MSASSRAAVADGWRAFLPSGRQMLWGVLAAFAFAVVLIGIAYASTSIPNPNSFATAQATTIYYKDGKTVMARFGNTSRIDVPLSKVPLQVRHAVLAAEDRNFYSEPGISPTGILRAMWVDLRGGDIQQGGSTITQQYVKNAYLTSQRTFTRKFKEIFIAVKLGNTRSKDEILDDYLNTIYFGRGAYGIEAAARAYFGKDVSALNASQGALLASLISNPTLYSPDTSKAASQARFQYVVDGMTKEGWLPAGKSTLAYPKVANMRHAQGQACVGPIGFICQAVQHSLATHGFDEARLEAGGYRVITTIGKKEEDAARKAMYDQQGYYQRSGLDKGREGAMISIVPGDGAIRAMYGGSEYCPAKKHPDSCVDLTGVASSYGRPPGSSFKPYTVIAALKEGISLDSTFSGPPSIDVNGTTIYNSQNESCGSCTLTQALAKSINTIFVPLAIKVGPDKVVSAAHDAGIPKSVQLDAVPVITLGPNDVSPLDQADAYATIAAQGIHADPYLVARVETQQHDVVYKAHKKTQRVFPADVMADTTYAMTKVLDCSSGGTACGKALTGRPAAGKTGTNGQRTGNKDAWFIGFTPQLSTAVWYGNHDRQAPVTHNGAPLYGGDLPAAAWQEMMNAALAGDPVEQFPPPAHVGSAQNQATPTATATATSSSPKPTPTKSSAVPVPTSSPTPPPIVPTQTSSSPAPTSSPTQGTGGGASKSPAPG
ncbi:MAG TPA: transglycosylase domain-containing protein [Mycobacteriales bacterium]|nr:transglycosylase domain-containing protein [Mycobacteriales bacterium]